MIEAEEAFRATKHEAVKVGIGLISQNQDSLFGKTVKVGFGSGRPIGDASVIMDRERIERWMDAVGKEEDAGWMDPSNYQPEEITYPWDAREIEFGESVSVIAEGKFKRRIAGWKEWCTEVARTAGQEKG